MGSINMNCALTGLPIIHNDDVVMLFTWQNHFITPSSNYDILHIPVVGKYSEDGWITNVEDDIVFKTFLKTIHSTLSINEKVTKKGWYFDIRDMDKIRLVQTSDLGTEMRDDYSSYEHVFILKKFWDKIINEYSFEDFFGNIDFKMLLDMTINIVDMCHIYSFNEDRERYIEIWNKLESIKESIDFSRIINGFSIVNALLSSPHGILDQFRRKEFSLKEMKYLQEKILETIFIKRYSDNIGREIQPPKRTYSQDTYYDEVRNHCLRVLDLIKELEVIHPKDLDEEDDLNSEDQIEERRRH